mmetsp:Transcript_58915/g.103104  ORF Transcript_58915/g.103104 Transcript_58915/m.103104 type:complete len:243 (-) Transcript_58915:288-1016(-)
MSMSRPSTSCDTSVSTDEPPTSFTSGSLSMSRTSATMWPCTLYCMLRKDNMQRKVSASAFSASPPLASTTIALAMCALTFTRSPISKGEPLRKTTFVPLRCFTGSCKASSCSISSFPSGASTTTTPPFSLSLAMQSSIIRRIVLSVNPKIKQCSLSMTLERPCLRLSIFSRITSTTTPRMDAKKMMPPTVMMAPTTRCSGMKSLECVPGSAMNVHASQMPSTKRLQSSSFRGSPSWGFQTAA